MSISPSEPISSFLDILGEGSRSIPFGSELNLTDKDESKFVSYATDILNEGEKKKPGMEDVIKAVDKVSCQSEWKTVQHHSFNCK